MKVEYTATLSTCAVLGFVMGPSIGAIFCQIDATMYGLSINANNAPGFLILVATCTMFVQVSVGLFVPIHLVTYFIEMEL